MKRPTQTENNSEIYDNWVCKDCASVNNYIWSLQQVVLFHNDKCKLCGQVKSVTDARNYVVSSFNMEIGCSSPIRFNTSEGIKTIDPDKTYNCNLDEIQKDYLQGINSF